MDFQAILNSVISWSVNVGIKLIISVILMFISFKLINLICRKIEKRGEKEHADKTILRTGIYILKLVTKCIVTVCLIGYLGIDTSAITALIASFGLCIGLAVNGALSNLAGGVLIIVTRPFRVDDYIEAQGTSGTVESIQLTHTTIVTPDNKVVHIPNGSLSSGNIVNYSKKDVRRVDFEFTVDYSVDFEVAQTLIKQVLSANDLVLKEPAEPFVRMSAHGASGIVIKARAWVSSKNYWSVYFDTLETVKKVFDIKGITIPYNQLDVHIKKD